MEPIKRLVAQLFRIFNGLPITGKQDGFVSASEVKRLTLVSYEPLKAWPTCAGPHLNRTNHEGLCKAIKNAHEKAPAFDRLGQRAMEGE
jgi:hypothetical protein